MKSSNLFVGFPKSFPMTSGAELVSQRLAQAPPLVIQENPVDPTTIPVPEGPLESGSSGSKDSKQVYGTSTYWRRPAERSSGQIVY